MLIQTVLQKFMNLLITAAPNYEKFWNVKFYHFCIEFSILNIYCDNSLELPEAILMSYHNICFEQNIKNFQGNFLQKTEAYLGLCDQHLSSKIPIVKSQQESI